MALWHAMAEADALAPRGAVAPESAGGDPLNARVEQGAEALRRAGVRYSHEFLALKSPPPGIDPRLFARMRAVCELAEIKGMGLVYADTLTRMGIRTPADLASCNPAELVRRIAEFTHGWRPPREAWAKVWIREARRLSRTGTTSRRDAEPQDANPRDTEPRGESTSR